MTIPRKGKFLATLIWLILSWLTHIAFFLRDYRVNGWKKEGWGWIKSAAEDLGTTFSNRKQWHSCKLENCICCQNANNNHQVDFEREERAVMQSKCEERKWWFHTDINITIYYSYCWSVQWIVSDMLYCKVGSPSSSWCWMGSIWQMA